MKAIIWGICDYLSDCWHDYKVHNGYLDDHEKWCISYRLTKWKEGNLWHYIRQRRISKRVKKIRK